MTTHLADVCIIGAGVIGCAIARELTTAGLSVVVLEAESKPGRGITSRNSEVIHGGMYYPSDSLKAKLCVSGRPLLYEYCRKNSIAHKKIGKLIIATTPDEERALEKISDQALANGIKKLPHFSRSDIKSLNRQLARMPHFFLKETGIISAHELCDSLEREASSQGATFAYRTIVIGLERVTAASPHWLVHTKNVVSLGGAPVSGVTGASHAKDFLALAPKATLGSDSFTLQARYVINSAGLYADWVSALAGMDPRSAGYELCWVKGEYFSLASRWSKQLSHLIYPIPEAHTRGLGTHVTLDISGAAKLGPNVVEIAREEDYRVDPQHQQTFLEAAKKFLADLQLQDLTPSYAGIRPKLSKAGEVAKDFVVCEESEKGCPGLINLIGIESPGLTCCLALGKMVKDLIPI